MAVIATQLWQQWCATFVRVEVQFLVLHGDRIAFAAHVLLAVFSSEYWHAAARPYIWGGVPSLGNSLLYSYTLVSLSLSLPNDLDGHITCCEVVGCGQDVLNGSGRQLDASAGAVFETLQSVGCCQSLYNISYWSIFIYGMIHVLSPTCVDLVHGLCSGACTAVCLQHPGVSVSMSCVEQAVLVCFTVEYTSTQL